MHATQAIAALHDQTVRLWEASSGEALGGPLRGHTSVVTAVAFGRLPDGQLAPQFPMVGGHLPPRGDGEGSRTRRRRDDVAKVSFVNW